jgi:hypothetical protein
MLDILDQLGPWVPLAAEALSLLGNQALSA